VTEAGNRHSSLALFFHIVCGTRWIAYLLRHLHYVLGSTAMRGTRQGGNCCNDGGMQIGFGPDYNPCGER
jgi:hypothetical protein